ncbi:unnamed protein product [Rotaria sp. Silwood1]|nr:unnamed protein product [Rotaria sp. Silwood1]CAF1623583.1 unnamed protein product [Rotaria sp. Silwood1]CAF3809064.1 unnamed protein product [Rotaria sp. Silwood1]CAF3843392.1 unnamed protein product [Rotaria sp. Silwood1]CAF3905113.1 unnamed protein product [Rotaria sp. Silwood1]
MAEKVYLVNPQTGSRHRINDCKRSLQPSAALKFSSARKYPNTALPESVDLSPGMTAVELQGDTSACVGNALAAAYEFLIKKKTGKDLDVSRLFIYYNGRIKDEPNMAYMEDSGCSITSGIAGLKEYGCCKEEQFPYDINKINEQPPAYCYAEAVNYRITNGMKLNVDLYEMKACLAQGYPFAFGLATFQSFADAETNGGIVSMPKPEEIENSQGDLHAMLAVGYIDQSQQFIVKNSWGPQWGDKGYGYIPYQYMSNPKYCSDLHTIKTISEVSRHRKELQIQNTNIQNTQTKHHGYALGHVTSPTSCINKDVSVVDDDDDDDDDESDYYKDNKFWKTERSEYIGNVVVKSQEIHHKNNHGHAASPKQFRPYIERIPQINNSSKSFILWIDKKNADNSDVANQLISDGKIHVDFRDTFAMAQDHIRQILNKIRSPSTAFQIVCRGYYKQENKNPFDLLLFLNKNNLKHIRVLVFTNDKQGLINHLEYQAPSVGLLDWKDRLYITSDSKKLITKCRSNIEKKTS